MAASGTLLIKILGDIGDFQKKMKEAQNVGTVLGAALGKVGIDALRMGNDYDEATDSIRTATGKTGDELAGLEDSFKNVAGRVKEDIGLTADVLGDLSTRTGLTGGDLEALTEKVIKFSRVTGTDATANTASITRLFGDWSIATEDQAGTMDKLLRASQATGLGVDSLMQTVVQFGAPLRAMGISMEESIALLGKWEKEGVNIETVLAGMRMAVGKFAAAGIDPAKGLPALIEKVKGLDDAQGLLAVKNVVGQRAANDFFRAIKEGRFDVDDLMETIEHGSETVDQAADDVRDFGDGFAELKNKVKLAVGPILDDFAGLTEELGNAVYLIPALGAALGRGLGKLWTKLGGSAAIKAAAGAAGAATGAVYAGGVRVAETLGAVLSAAWTKIGGRAAVRIAAGAAGAAAGAIYAGAVRVAEALGGALSVAWGAIPGSAKVGQAISGAGNKMGGMLGKALIIGATVALVAMLPKMWDDMVNTWNRVTAGKQDIEGAKQAFLASLPTRAEVEARLADLRTVPSSLTGIQRALWDMGAGGAKELWRKQIADLENYLRTQAFDGTGQAVTDGINANLPKPGDIDFIGPLTPDQQALVKANQEAGQAGAEAAGQGYDAGIRSKDWSTSIVEQFDASIARGRDQLLEPFRQIGRNIPGEIGKGMQATANVLIDGTAALRDILENGTSPRSRAMLAIGAEYIKLVRRGMDSEKDGAKETAQEVAIAAINTIEDAGLKGKKGQRGLRAIGIYFDELLASGMMGPQALAALDAAGVSASSEALAGVRSKYPQFFNTGVTAANKVHDGLTSKPWNEWGANVGAAWGRGVARGIAGKRGAIINAIPRGALEGFSPPKEGPLKNIDKWGLNIGGAWIGGIAKGISAGARTLGRGLQMPSLGGGLALSPATARGVGFGGPTVVEEHTHYHDHYHGDFFRDPQEYARLGGKIKQGERHTKRGGRGW